MDKHHKQQLKTVQLVHDPDIRLVCLHERNLIPIPSLEKSNIKGLSVGIAICYPGNEDWE